MAKRIGELLIEAKVISQEQLDHALAIKRDDGRKLGQILIDLKLASETQLTQTLSRQLSVPWVSLYHITFSRSLLNYVSRELAERFTLVPIFVRKVRKQGETLYVAMDDPTNDAALAEVAKSVTIPVRPMIACPSDIKSAIRVYYLGGGSEPALVAAAAVPPPAPSASKLAAAAPPPLRPRATSVPEIRETLPDVTTPEVEPGATPLSGPVSDDSPDADPEIEAMEVIARPRRGPRMVALTLLDGTTITLPAKKKVESKPDPDEHAEAREQPLGDQLTARDLISAFRAVAHGADASEILGERPPQWEAMFATLLSLLLKKGIIADWEFIEEFRKA